MAFSFSLSFCTALGAKLVLTGPMIQSFTHFPFGGRSTMVEVSMHFSSHLLLSSHRSLAIYKFLSAIRHGKLIPSRILDPLPTLHKLPNNARHGTRFLISGCVMFSRLSSNLDAEAGSRLAQKGRNRDPSRPSSCERRGRKFEIQIYLTSAGSAYSYSSSFSSSDLTFLRSMLSITQCRPRGPSAGIYVGLY